MTAGELRKLLETVPEDARVQVSLRVGWDGVLSDVDAVQGYPPHEGEPARVGTGRPDGGLNPGGGGRLSVQDLVGEWGAAAEPIRQRYGEEPLAKLCETHAGNQGYLHYDAEDLLAVALHEPASGGPKGRGSHTRSHTAG